MKNILFKLYLFYINHSPIHRGKQFLAILLTRLLGSNFHKTKKNIWLDIYLKSPQDIYLLNFDGNDKLSQLIESLPAESIFLDIGANIGYYTFLASKHLGNRGKVFCFEPSFREYIRLLRGIQKNELTNIIPFNACLSNTSGELLINISNDHTGLNKIQTIANNNDTNRVAVFRYDNLQDIFAFQKIDLAKIDVEGAEYLVLLGMEVSLKRGLFKMVYVEITPMFLNEYGHSKEMIYDFMTNCGFFSTINSNEWQYDEIFIFDYAKSIT